MAWYNESRRHSLASRGIRTTTNDKPVVARPMKKCLNCGALSKDLYCSNWCKDEDDARSAVREAYDESRMIEDARNKKFLSLIDKINLSASKGQAIKEKEFTAKLMNERMSDSQLNDPIFSHLSNDKSSDKLFMKVEKLDPTNTVVFVDIDYAISRRGNRINTISYKSTDNLKKLIKKGVVLDSPPVYSLSTGKIEEGNHRVQALKELGYKSVPVYLSGGWD